jgi:hypothetical protein
MIGDRVFWYDANGAAQLGTIIEDNQDGTFQVKQVFPMFEWIMPASQMFYVRAREFSNHSLDPIKPSNPCNL